MKFVVIFLISIIFVSCDSKRVEELEQKNMALQQLYNSCWQDKNSMESQIESLEYERNNLEEEIHSLKSDIDDLEMRILMRF